MSSSEDKRVQVKIEVGHQSFCRDVITPTGFTHDWNIFVRGAEGNDISHFVEKVVFLLHESFNKPRRVCKEPPYKVAESGYGSFNLPVEIYFRNSKEEPRKYRLDYDLFLQLVGKPPVLNAKVEALTFLNPSEDFEAKLLRGGAVILPPATSPALNTVVQEPSRVSKSVSPPSSIDSSPNSQKKAHTSSLTKVAKVKDYQSAIIKRPNISDDDANKSKKKKFDKNDFINPPVKAIKEVSILSPNGVDTPDATKMKNSHIKKAKERRKSTDTFMNSSPKGGPITKEVKQKGKEIKVKKEKMTSPPETSNNNDELPKLQKFTIKRMSDDVYVKKHPVNGIVANNNGVHNNNNNNNVAGSDKHGKRFNAILSELANESNSSGDDMKIDVPVEVEQPSSKVSDAGKTNKIQTPVNVNRTAKPKKAKVHKSLLNGNSIEKKENPTKARATDAGKTLPKAAPTPAELYELYTIINSIEDDNLLQKVVDIVEETGQFDVTSTTFDFDLCSLDRHTIGLIKQFLVS